MISPLKMDVYQIFTFGGKVSVAVPHGILELVLHVRAGQADRQQVLSLDVQAA